MLSKEDKKIKIWGIRPHFYNIWVQKLIDFQSKLLVQLELSFFKNVAKHKLFLFRLI